MPVSEESAKLQALVQAKWPHLPYRWLTLLNTRIGKIRAEHGWYFDIFGAFRGEELPQDTKYTIYDRMPKLND